jgi:hypothetical protein
MWYFIVKAILSGLIIAIVSEISRKLPAFGALVASLPLISVLGMIWLYKDTRDNALIAEHAFATFWYVLPSLPLFIVLPLLLRSGMGFPLALGLSCLLTIVLYFGMVWAFRQFDIKL